MTGHHLRTTPAIATPTCAAADLMPALTGIRFPLALWVVAHHLSGQGRLLDPLTSASAPIHALIDAAWVALSVFFAISGFVLARRYSDALWSRAAVARYTIARFGRVYPVYFLSLLILVPIMADAMRGDQLGSTADRVWLMANHLFLLQGWERPAVNWNTPAWSLSCEVFFYACFPVVIVLLRRPSWTRLLAATAIAFAFPIALRLSLEPPIAKPLLYFGDFLTGVVAARVYDRISTRPLSLPRLGPWLYGPAAVGGLVLLLYRETFGSFLVFDSGVRLASGLLVFGLACGGGGVWRMLSTPLMLVGGRASYAIYILHIPVLWWYERSMLLALMPSVAAGFLYVILVVLLSIVVSRGYEEPANAIIRAWFAKRLPRHSPVSSDGRGFAGTIGLPGR